MKYLPYFKFDAESWLTGKVQLLPVDEIGIYINLISRIWKAGGSLKNDRFLPRLLGATKEQFNNAMQDFIELDIITINDDNEIHIKFIDDQIAERAVFISKCSAGGKNKASKATLKGTNSNVQGTSTNLEVTPNVPLSNKIIEEKKREEKSINNAPVYDDDTIKVLGAELAQDFLRWLSVWRDTHGNGQEMPVFQKEAQLRLLYSLPVEVRKQALESAIRGAWKALHDIRQPRQNERATVVRQTGVLNEQPVFSNNERGKK